MRKHLLLAAENKIARGDSLRSRLYIPEVFTVDQRDAINARRMAQWSRAIAAPSKSQRLMLLIAEVKEALPTRYGFKAVVKHVPDQAFAVRTAPGIPANGDRPGRRRRREQRRRPARTDARLQRQPHGFDAFIVPTVPARKQQQDTAATLAELARIGVPAQRVRLVFNQVEDDSPIETVFDTLLAYCAASGHAQPRMDTCLRYNEVYARVRGTDRSLVELAADTNDYKA